MQILFKFLFKLGEIALIVHTLVKPSGKLWCDSPGLNPVKVKCRKNEKEFCRFLWLRYLIHADFRYEMIAAFPAVYMSVNFCGLSCGQQELFANMPDKILVNLEGGSNPLDFQRTGIGDIGFYELPYLTFG
jgi:hypothetical protein